MDVISIFEQFKNKRVLVVGDVMIDAYVNGKVTRVSPEAPVPIVNLSDRQERLGGAANVALNLQALNATPILCSVIGNDQGGDTLLNIMQDASMELSGIVRSSQRKTTVKTRVVGNNQQLLRIDDEIIAPILSAEEDSLIQTVSELIPEVDAIIFEDYNKGVLTERTIQEIIRIANENGVITTVDPKKDNFFAYKNVTMFKPNLKELKEGLQVEFKMGSEKELFENAVNQLNVLLPHQISFVTLSEHGVFIQDSEKRHYVPAHLRNIADVSGAGDTVIAVATLCLAVGMDLRSVAEWANLAGGLVCERSGVVPIDKNQLIAEVKKLQTS